VTAELRLRHGIVVSRKRVQRLRRAAGISGLVARKRGRTTIRVPGVRVADDLVKRDFRPDHPDVLWVADITYLRTWEGWLYLAAVQDAYSRRIVGWSMADHMRAELVVDALQMALHRRRPAPSLVHHSPGQPVRQPGLRPESPRRRHRRLDGLTRRLLRQRHGRELLRHAQEGARPPPLLAHPPRAHHGGLQFAEAFYNTTRRHPTLAYLSPAQYEAMTMTNNQENIDQLRKPDGVRRTGFTPSTTTIGRSDAWFRSCNHRWILATTGTWSNFNDLLSSGPHDDGAPAKNNIALVYNWLIEGTRQYT
jgi:putative transposase